MSIVPSGFPKRPINVTSPPTSVTLTVVVGSELRDEAGAAQSTAASKATPRQASNAIMMFHLQNACDNAAGSSVAERSDPAGLFRLAFIRWFGSEDAIDQ